MAGTSVEPICLEPADLAPFRSTYLHEGRRTERYVFHDVRIQGDRLDARLDILNPFVSASDSGGFHLSIYPAQEACGELGILYMHKRLGLSGKSSEVWMRECRCSIRRPIRAVTNIFVAMICPQFRVVKGMVYVRVSFSLSDEQGGLFLIEQRGGMALAGQEV